MSTGDTPSFPTAYEQPVGAILAAISSLVFLMGLWAAYVLYRQPNHKLKNVIVVAWALVPPLYFLFNYYVLFRIYGHWDDEASVAHYRYSQGLFTKLWAAVGALVALIVSGRVKSPTTGHRTG